MPPARGILCAVNRALAYASILAPSCLTELDARCGTPPNHVKAIVAALDAMPAGRPQSLRTKARPVRLLQELAALGVEGESGALPDGSWRTLLRRTAAAA